MLQEQQAVEVSRAVYLLLNGKGKNHPNYEGDYEASIIAATEICSAGCKCVVDGPTCPLCRLLLWIDTYPMKI